MIEEPEGNCSLLALYPESGWKLLMSECQGGSGEGVPLGLGILTPPERATGE